MKYIYLFLFLIGFSLVSYGQFSARGTVIDENQEKIIICVLNIFFCLKSIYHFKEVDQDIIEAAALINY